MKYKQLTQDIQRLTNYLLATEFTELVNEFEIDNPIIKIVNRTKSRWLGSCDYNFADTPNTSVITVNLRATYNTRTLERVILHELIHHIDFVKTYRDLGCPVKVSDLIKFRNKRDSYHRGFFTEQLTRLNAKYGVGYITVRLNATYLTEQLTAIAAIGG